MTEQYPQYPEDHVQQPYYGDHPAGYGPPANYGPPPENNVVWAILSTVLCCMPLGVVALVKSNQVHSLWFQGFHAEARKAAEDTRKWAMWSAIALGILILLYIAFFVVMIVIIDPDSRHLP